MLCGLKQQTRIKGARLAALTDGTIGCTIRPRPLLTSERLSRQSSESGRKTSSKEGKHGRTEEDVPCELLSEVPWDRVQAPLCLLREEGMTSLIPLMLSFPSDL